MVVTKILLVISILISIIWLIKSEYDYEPIVVIVGLIINFISLYIESKGQGNTMKVKSEMAHRIQQANEGNENQNNSLTFEGNADDIIQMNKK